LPFGTFDCNQTVYPDRFRRYNTPMTSPMQDKAHPHAGHSRHHVYAMEATGLLIIAATLLAITLVRFWQAMQWSLR
jgi:hypothetical protein